MSENCPACQKRQHMLSIQMEGRDAARKADMMEKNPYTDPIEKQYWEYGWIEENFLEEIDEHRAIMDYAGEHIFQLTEQIVEGVNSGMIASKTGDELIASLSTVAGKLANKLQGG